MRGEKRMVDRFIVSGQRVEQSKVERARELRHSMTEEERLLWKQLRERRLLGLRFRRQQIIDGFIVDFYCPSVGLVVEVDGPVHDERADYDRERDQVIAARGLTIIRVRNDEVRNDMVAVLARISAEARVVDHSTSGEMGCEPPSP